MHPRLPSDAHLHSHPPRARPHQRGRARAQGRALLKLRILSLCWGHTQWPPGNKVFTGRDYPLLPWGLGFCGSRKSVSCNCFQHDRRVKSTPLPFQINLNLMTSVLKAPQHTSSRSRPVSSLLTINTANSLLTHINKHNQA